MNVLNKSLADLDHAKEVYETLVKDAVQPVLTHIAQMPDVNIIYIRGWTPGFNDGEPCEHTVDFCVNLEDIFHGGVHEEESFEQLAVQAGIDHIFCDYELPYVSFYDPDPKDLEAFNEMVEDIQNKTGFTARKPNDRSVYEAIDKVIVPALDREFGTNYAVLYVFRNGIQIDRYVDDEYDCGY